VSKPADNLMLEIFRAELLHNGQTLEAVCRATPDHPVAGWDSLLKGTQSIRAAARVAGLKPLAEVSDALTFLLGVLQRTGVLPGKPPWETAGRAIRLLLTAAEMEPAQIALDTAEKAAEFQQLTEELRAEGTRLEQAAVDNYPRGPVSAPPVDAQGPWDPVILDLFRTELQNQTRVLESGLVGLEKEQTPQRVEPLMRSAHSIKGAARVVGLDHAVKLAHAMEDLLSAAQHSRITLSVPAIDLLLAANDVFGNLAGSPVAALPALLGRQASEIDRLVAALRAHLAEQSHPPVEPAVPIAPVRESGPAPLPGQESEVGEASLVRVLAENLNRLMGLTGECLVQAKASKAFAASWARTKSWQMELGSGLERLNDWATSEENLEEEVRNRLLQSVSKAEQIAELVRVNLEQFELFSAKLEQLTDRLYSEVVATRMRPFSEGVFAFPRMVRDQARTSGKNVKFEILGESTRVDRDILEKLEAPLTHLLRNAVDHGVESAGERRAKGKPEEATITLDARHASGMLHISLRDDGRGIDREKLRAKVVERGYATSSMAARLTGPELLEFLFLPGFSTAERVTETSGRGVGLDIVHSMAKEVGGTAQVESTEGEGTTFHLRLPLTLSVIRTLVVEIASQHYALPLTRIDRVVTIPRSELQVLEDRQFYFLDGEPLGLLEASQVLQLAATGRSDDRIHALVLSDRLNRYGLVVCRFLGERDLVVLPLDPRLKRIPNISAGAILEDGTPLLILDVDDLVRSIDNLLTQGKPGQIGEAQAVVPAGRKRVLVVDDSLTVREVERRLLENHGYDVVVGIDGMDGWNNLQTAHFDLLVTDVDMPRMDGIELVRRVKATASLKDLPVMIVSYKDREEDRLKGLEAGANYYLTKSSFHDETLIAAVEDLIGGA
jgi:two-component system, chemotaxis family, sensor histidine kinase and response regulator WspE